jgi:MFS transporter, FSR family, fosmidomycin resistance protein
MKTHSTTREKQSLFALSLAHVVNDWYMNLIPVLIPFLTFTIGVGKGALLVASFTVSSSLMQPLFGYVIDKGRFRWIFHVGTLWMAGLLAVTGTGAPFPVLLGCAAMAGLGTAAFHPQASALAAAAGGSNKGFRQAVFIASGNIGWALAPLLIIPFIQRFGLTGTPWLAIPGLMVTLLLSGFFIDRKTDVKKTVMKHAALSSQDKAQLVILLSVVACRSLVYFGMISFLPLYLAGKGIPVGSSGKLLFIMLFSGAIGGLIGGFISDHIGRKKVITFSLIAAGIFFPVFLAADGIFQWIFLALAGGTLLASFSVTVVASHRLLKGRTALASGIILGLGTGIGGLGVGISGQYAQHGHITEIVSVLALLPFLAGVISLALKERSNKVPTQTDDKDHEQETAHLISTETAGA